MPDGIIVPMEAAKLALDLEYRGVRLVPEGPDGLLVGPKALITDDDRTAIRKWRLHLRAILACADRVVA